MKITSLVQLLKLELGVNYSSEAEALADFEPYQARNVLILKHRDKPVWVLWHNDGYHRLGSTQRTLPNTTCWYYFETPGVQAQSGVLCKTTRDTGQIPLIGDLRKPTQQTSFLNADLPMSESA